MRRCVPGVLLLAGCYTYAPIEPAAARPGTGVRARITAEAGKQLAPLLGAADVRLLAGTLIENGPTGIIIEVPTIMPADAGITVQTLHQRVSVSRADLLELETRQLDGLRTGALAGGLAVIVGGATIRALKGDGSSGVFPGGGGSDIRITLVRIVP